MRTPARGRFHCPHCQAARTYAHKRVQKMLVVLNVPVARKGEEAEFVQCGFCRKAFMPSVLESGPPNLLRDVDGEGDQDWHYAELTGAAASTLLVWGDGGD